MISDFFVVLYTKNLASQLNFYRDLLSLECIFQHEDALGLGKNNRLFIILRIDKSKDSHHLAYQGEQKGPLILSFNCGGSIEDYIKKLQEAKILIRNELKLVEQGMHYLFIEDADGNEICLNLPLKA